MASVMPNQDTVQLDEMHTLYRQGRVRRQEAVAWIG